MPPPEAAEQPGHYLLGGGRHRGDAKLAALGVGRADRRPVRLVQQAQDGPGVARVLGAGLGQAQAPAIRAEQLQAQRLLQRAERRGDGRLRHDEFRRGGADRSALGDGEERPQLVKRHDEQLRRRRFISLPGVNPLDS